jgi:hypothetical protein
MLQPNQKNEGEGKKGRAKCTRKRDSAQKTIYSKNKRRSTPLNTFARL